MEFSCSVLTHVAMVGLPGGCVVAFVQAMLVFSHLLLLQLTRQAYNLSDTKIDRPNCTVLMIDFLGVVCMGGSMSWRCPAVRSAV